MTKICTGVLKATEVRPIPTRAITKALKPRIGSGVRLPENDVNFEMTASTLLYPANHNLNNNYIVHRY
jgi:hypothetical protein